MENIDFEVCFGAEIGNLSENVPNIDTEATVDAILDF